MLYSMTGFGTAQQEIDGKGFLVEIKTLNNRFLKTSIKMPEALLFAESEVERLIRSKLCRGSVSYSMHMRQGANNSSFEVNTSVLQSYVDTLEQVKTLRGDSNALQIDMGGLLQLPGVCQIRQYSQEEQEQYLEIIRKLTLDALDGLCEMRALEGQGVLKDLQQQCKVIEKNLNALAKLSKLVLERYHQRLQQRVDDLLSDVKLKVDNDMIAREVAVFAERSDINEEVDRLGSHLKQFASACELNEQIGRRLDFLTQEMLREANTIASKANDAEISHHVVEIKVAIDRLREQVQNVE